MAFFRQLDQSAYQKGRLPLLPVGVFVRVRMISGRELDGQIVKIETTDLGALMHVEYDEGIIKVTKKQVLGCYHSPK